MKMYTPGIRSRMDDNFNKMSYRGSLSPTGFLDKGNGSDLEGL